MTSEPALNVWKEVLVSYTESNLDSHTTACELWPQQTTKLNIDTVSLGIVDVLNTSYFKSANQVGRQYTGIILNSLNMKMTLHYFDYHEVKCSL